MIRVLLTCLLIPGALMARPAPPSAAPASKAPASKAPASKAPASKAPASKAPESTAPAHPELPALIRAGLGNRMLRHGKALGGLEAAVAAMDFVSIARHAQAIVSEPRLARPLPTEPSANSGIPEVFFGYQDQLHAHATALLSAATDRDAAKVKRAHTELGQVCGRCHRLWMPSPGEP